MQITIPTLQLSGFHGLGPSVYLRIYALQTFTASSDQQIIQAAAPGSGNFYTQVTVPVSDSSVFLPELVIESTTDAINPNERGARYFAGFYRTNGGLIQPYYKFEQFWLAPTPQTQTWADIAGYNSQGQPPPVNWNTYTKDQILALFETGDFDVLPPLVFDGTTLYIPKASATQDGYVSKEDFQMFLEGTDVGISQIDAGTGLVTGTGLPITDTGTLLIADQPDLMEGVYVNPMLTVNKQGQITHIESGSGGPVTIPVITAIASSAVDDAHATITWDTVGIPSDSQVEYGIGSAYNFAFPVPPASSPQIHHSVTLSGLTQLTTYTYRVKSTNLAGTATSTTTDTFTTLATADVTAPIITVTPETSIGETSAVINWTTDELSDSVVIYGDSIGSYPNSASNSSDAIPPGPGTTDHHVNLSGLASSHTYHYQVQSKDAAGNPRTSPDHSFTTLTPDTTGPAITNIRVQSGSITNTAATILWDTLGEAGDSQVFYSADPDTGEGTATTVTETTPLVNNHTVVLGTPTPLVANTLYHYHVKSKDVLGNPTTSPLGVNSFTTTNVTVMDPTIGLVSYWTMDETVSPRLDAKGLNPLLAQAGSGGSDSPSAAGKIGNSLLGTGAAWMGAPDYPASYFAGSFTVAGWVMLESTLSQIATLCSKWQASGQRVFYCHFNGYAGVGGTLQFAISKNGIDVPTASPGADIISPGLVLGQWHFWAGWFNFEDQTIHMWLDDGTVTTSHAVGGVDGPAFPGVGPLHLVYTDGVTGLLTQGRVDELGVWNRVLSTAELSYLWHGGAGRTYPFSPP